MGPKLRLAVFVSGGGSNLQSILDSSAKPDYPAEVVAVVSNDPDAFGLERARRAGVEALAVSHRGHPTREDHERQILRLLEPFEPQAAALAGYMRLVTPVLIDAFYDRERDLPGLLNIHPADTGAYQGAHGYEFAMGLLPEHPRRLTETKITVHFVDAGMDTGPIIKQAVVPIHQEDTIDDVRARGLAVEHELYPQVVRLYAEGCLRLTGGKVVIDESAAGIENQG